MLDKIGFGEGDSGQGEWQPHHTRHGTRMDKQPTILAVHSPSRIRNAIARVLPLATPLLHLCGWGPCVAGGRGPPARSFPRVPFFIALLCPHSCAPPHRQIYMADTSNIKYHVSRIQRAKSRPGVGRITEWGGPARRATPHASTHAQIRVRPDVRPHHPSLQSVK